jgi:hypothetical protein
MEEGGLFDESGIEDFGGLLVAPPATGGTATGGTVTGTGTVTGASGATTTGGAGWTGAVSAGGGPTGAGLGVTSTGFVLPPGSGAGAGIGTRAGTDAPNPTLSCVGAEGTCVGRAGTNRTVLMGGLVKSGRTISSGALNGTRVVTVFLAITSRV